MSNRYFDMDLVRISRNRHDLAPLSKAMKEHMRMPTAEKEKKNKQIVNDITEGAMRIVTNNAYANKIRQLQDAANYRNELERINGLIKARRIAKNRLPIYRGRMEALKKELEQIQPIITEGGKFKVPQ